MTALAFVVGSALGCGIGFCVGLFRERDRRLASARVITPSLRGRR